MTPASTLPELIHQLGTTHSPYERLKILGRAWSLLRTMTPDQRLAVAAQLGLDQADEVVEAIATRSGGQPPQALLEMIETAQAKGTAQLPQLITDLRDPRRRRRRLEEGTAALKGALTGEAPASTWLPPGAASPVPLAPPVKPQPAARKAPPPLPPQAPLPATPEPVAAPQPAPPPEPIPAAPPPAEEPAPVPEPTPALEPKPTAAPPPPQPPPEPARPAPPPVSAAPEGEFADRLAAVTSLTLRFRVFRRHLKETQGMSAAGLRAVVEEFPDGWARRRALIELFRAGAPAALQDALVLLEGLSAERDRLWCLGALADFREIPAGEQREALLAAAPSPMARRRLEGRMRM